MIFNQNRQYFRVESGRCWDILSDWREDRNDINRQCLNFAYSVGGTGFYAGPDDNVGNALAVTAITFNDAPPKGWKERRWKSLIVAKGQVPAWPDQRTTVGREALKEIKRLPLRPSTYKACDAIGFPAAVDYSNGESRGSSMLGFWETMTVGWSGDTFYVGLPKLAEEIAKLQAEGYTVHTPLWQPLPGMEPILKEEMELDFARAKLRNTASAMSAGTAATTQIGGAK